MKIVVEEGKLLQALNAIVANYRFANKDNNHIFSYCISDNKVEQDSENTYEFLNRWFDFICANIKRMTVCEDYNDDDTNQKETIARRIAQSYFRGNTVVHNLMVAHDIGDRVFNMIDAKSEVKVQMTIRTKKDEDKFKVDVEFKF